MRRARFSVNKRQRERAREEKRKKKAERREQRKLEDDKPAGAGEDPDLAGIVPGPQPKPWDESELPPFELGEEGEEGEDGEEGSEDGSEESEGGEGEHASDDDLGSGEGDRD